MECKRGYWEDGSMIFVYVPGLAARWPRKEVGDIQYWLGRGGIIAEVALGQNPCATIISELVK